MTVTVVFALGAEFAPWRRRRPFRRTGPDGRAVYQARIGGAQVRVTTCGIGAPHARAALDATDADRADAIVMAGIAGGLKPQYASGQILAARRVRAADGAPGIAADEQLLARAAGCGAAIVGSFLSTGRIMARAEDKRRLGAEDDAVDMESAAVLREAHARGIPGIAIRTVGDTVSEDLPIDVSRAIDPGGTIAIRRLMVEALRRPGRWPALVRFGTSQRRAMVHLATFLDRFISSM